MKKRNLDEERDIYIGNTGTIDLDKLTLKEFKQHMIEALSKLCTQRQCYLTTDPLTEKYLFWWHGQIRFISVQVVENMLRKKQLLYYTDHFFRVKDMIVGKNFKFKRDKAIRTIRGMFAKRKNKKRQL